MKNKYLKIALVVLFAIRFNSYAQGEDAAVRRSNIQTYTPSVLLTKGQWDIKFFNNLVRSTFYYFIYLFF